MNAKEIRHQLQAEGSRLISDWTHEDLVHVLQKSCAVTGGLSIFEIAECIAEVLKPEQYRALADKLNQI